MSWQLKDQYVSAEIGHHVIVLEHDQTGAQHIVQIVIGAAGCPLCGHVHVADVEELDVQKVINDEIAALEKAHAQVVPHARKHRVPIRKAE